MLHPYKIYYNQIPKFFGTFSFEVDINKIIIKNNFVFFKYNKKNLAFKNFKKIILSDSFNRKRFDLFIKYFEALKVKKIYFFKDKNLIYLVFEI